MPNIKDTIYSKSQLWSNSNGRDYIRIGDEVYSINGLYCNAQGEQDRWGQHVRIMDVRWPVMVCRQYDGKLEYQGDGNDIAALLHWGYSWPSMNEEGYKRVPMGEERTQVAAPAAPTGPTKCPICGKCYIEPLAAGYWECYDCGYLFKGAK